MVTLSDGREFNQFDNSHRFITFNDSLATFTCSILEDGLVVIAYFSKDFVEGIHEYHKNHLDTYMYDFSTKMTTHDTGNRYLTIFEQRLPFTPKEEDIKLDYTKNFWGGFDFREGLIKRSNTLNASRGGIIDHYDFIERNGNIIIEKAPEFLKRWYEG